MAGVLRLFRRRRPALTADDLDLLQACAKGRLWFDPRTERAMRDGDSGEASPVDVAALRDAPGGPLVIHDAVDWSLPAQVRPSRVPFRVTLAGEARL